MQNFGGLPHQNEAANSIKANVITDEGIRMDLESSG